MSEIKIGDKVKFLNEVGGGRVVEIIDKELVKIRTDDDWDIPAMRSELLVMEPAQEESEVSLSEKISSSEEKEKAENKPVPEKEAKAFAIPKTVEVKDSDRLVLFGLVPSDAADILNSNLDAYLINDSEYSLLYNYVIFYDGMKISREAGILEPETKFLLETYPREKLNKLSGIIIQLIFYKPGQYIPHTPVEKTLKPDARKFYKEGSFKTNDYFDDVAIIFTVFNSLEEKINTISADEIKTALSQKNAPGPGKHHEKLNLSDKDEEMIVDLHIQELIENYSGISNAEIMEIQMNSFRKAMDEAIQKRKKKLVLVHGVGQGTLKQDIRSELEKDFKSFEFQDASFKEYGYGATLVLIRQNYRPRRGQRSK
ncbi:MAG: DUF2027 domain-containing protein [Bacteroidota bacterium]|nr:DUF2027 domain-containing protein [Bacteroidota bacterium]